MLHNLNREQDNELLYQKLFYLNYEVSQYTTKIIYEPKERIIKSLPHFPDGITNHIFMNVLEPI